MSHKQRVVLEVDDKHHYASEDGRAAPAVYAQTMLGDCELKLSGYEVYRFGAVELSGPEQGREVVESFFRDLYRSANLSTA